MHQPTLAGFLRGAAAGVLLALAGGGAGCHLCCGYKFGNDSLYRPDIRTVYVPMFESDSFRRGLGERLTEAVVKEIESRTPYKVVSSADADSVLIGQLTFERKRLIAENINDDPRVLEMSMVVQISWYDRRGQLVVEPVVLPLGPLSFTAHQDAVLIAESGQSVATSQQNVIDRLASDIVYQMQAPW